MKQDHRSISFRRPALLFAAIVLFSIPMKGICGSANGGFWWKSNTLPYDTEFSYFFDVAVYPQGIFLDDQKHNYAYVTGENKHIKYNGIPYGVETVTAYFNNNATGGFVLLWQYDDPARFTNAWIDEDSDVDRGWSLSTLDEEGYLITENNGTGETQKFLRVQEQTVFISESTNPVQSTWENRYYFYNFTRQQWDQKMQDTFVIPASRQAVSAATAQTGDGEWAGILETSGDTNDVDHGIPPVKVVSYMNRSIKVVDQGSTSVLPLDSSLNSWEAAVSPYQLLYLTPTNYDQFVLGWNGADPFITTNPASTLVAPGGSTTLTVAGIGASPLRWQWFKNGSPISGATNAVYATPALSTSDSGNTYYAVVSDKNSSMTSAVATLTVAESQVVGWGETNGGALDIPSGLTNVTAIAGGPDYALALKNNGTVAAWGSDVSGQTNIPRSLAGVIQIGAGYYNCLALRSNGTVVAWGADYWGISHVPSGLHNVISIAAGGEHCLALKNNGTVIAWGDTNIADGSPALVPRGLSQVVSISAGQTHSLALKSDGTVTAWGDNAYSQSTVPAGLSNVISISAGNCYSLALRSNGTVVAWGDDTYGETDVPPGLTNVVSISAGEAWCSLALKSDGTIVTWGMAGTDTLAPPSNLVSVTSIAAGGYFALAVQTAVPAPLAELSGIHLQKRKSGLFL